MPSEKERGLGQSWREEVDIVSPKLAEEVLIVVGEGEKSPVKGQMSKSICVGSTNYIY